jgi:hypothetical protein
MVARPGNRAGDGSEGGGFAVLNPLGGYPADGGCCCCKLRVDKGAGGQRTGIECAAGVEAEPAHPQQSGTDEAEHHGVGRHILLRIAGALAEVEAGDQGRDAAGDVDYGASGKVEDRPAAAGDVEDSTDAPDHVSHGAVDDERPEGEKDRHGAELDALGKSAGDKRRSNDGEHELVDHEGLLGDGATVVGIGRQTHAAEEDVLKAADDAVARSKGQ